MTIKPIAFCILLSLTGCDFGNSSEGFDNPKDDCHSYLTAKVDGERFNAEVCDVTEWNYVANAPHIIISGSTSDLQTGIVLEIFDLRQGDTGAYNTTGRSITEEVRALYHEERGIGADDVFTTPKDRGTITIEEFSRTLIRGTFEFTGSTGDGASVSITEGLFRLDILAGQGLARARRSPESGFLRTPTQ